MKEAILIGTGLVGSEIQRLGKGSLRIKYLLRTTGIYSESGDKLTTLSELPKYTDVDIAIIAIPTLDNGERAFEYLLHFLKKGVPVVTCEKGALANFFPELKPYLRSVGYSATVGGGTRMIPFLQGYDNKKIESILAVINGTLNYIGSQIAAGEEPRAAVTQAIENGYTEPGPTGLIALINNEMQDVLLKCIILANTFNKDFELRASNVPWEPISESQLEEIASNSKTLRCQLSISKSRPASRIGGFLLKEGDWYIAAGFMPIERLGSNVSLGVENILIIKGSDGERVLRGPGAGKTPTALSMLEDVMGLLGE
ncbi:MAG: hypothetical protein Q7S15_00365 [bacterium]|nr:hypothetical protein [bacterium]